MIFVGGKHSTGMTVRIKSKRNPCTTYCSQFTQTKQIMDQDETQD